MTSEIPEFSFLENVLIYLKKIVESAFSLLGQRHSYISPSAPVLASLSLLSEILLSYHRRHHQFRAINTSEKSVQNNVRHSSYLFIHVMINSPHE